MQSKRKSALESWANTTSGFLINIAIVQLGNWFGFWQIPLVANIMLSLLMYVISFARGYFIRRAFNHFADSSKTI